MLDFNRTILIIQAGCTNNSGGGGGGGGGGGRKLPFVAYITIFISLTIWSERELS